MSRQATAERIGQILADADDLGDKKAAELHGVSVRTVRRYRARSRANPELAADVRKKRQQAAEAWLPRAKEVRLQVLDLGLKLAQETKDLHDLAGFLKIVSDAINAHEMLALDGEFDRPSTGLAGSQEAGATVAGGAGGAAAPTGSRTPAVH